MLWIFLVLILGYRGRMSVRYGKVEYPDEIGACVVGLQSLWMRILKLGAAGHGRMSTTKIW